MSDVRRFGNGPPLVALHGFTLTGRQFASAGSMLDRTIVAPDLPGHGRNTDASTDLDDVIDLVASTVASVGSPVPVLGYSQGARLGLLTALERPDGISALVLVSANAGIEDAQERAARVRTDSELASDLTTMTIDEFLETWTTAGITATTHLSAEDRHEDMALRRENSPRGLAGALVGYGQGAQPSVWHRLADLSIPILVLAGNRDEKYSSIAVRIAQTVPEPECVIIDDAGHNPLADAPVETYGLISAFLDRLG